MRRREGETPVSDQEGLPSLRGKAADILARLSSTEREALLIKCWMSHDARWFMTVAREYGMEVANRLNQAAAHEIGKVEARRIVRALELPPLTTVDEYLLAQEVFIGLLGPELLDYEVTKVGDEAWQIRVLRCFANENAVRAGVADAYDCGIFARTTGWLEALGLDYEMAPPLGRCQKVGGRECAYTFRLKPESPPVGTPVETAHGLS